MSQAVSSFDAMLDEFMYAATLEAEHLSPQLAGMMRYHLGWVDEQFAPIDAESIDRGKRVRPRLATLTCRAVSGSDLPARQLAASIELLHNFTLVHDDIQDQSQFRRHRRTVWGIWGAAQAINTGDAMYAASRRTLLDTTPGEFPVERLLQIAAEFDRVAIEIVAGQVTDLEFEGGRQASHDDYLQMIGMKTAAIVEFAAWAGAMAAGAGAELAGQFGRFGRSLGLGFQIRDDVLGIWGAQAETGKAGADDIRRRKQSLPVILLRESSSSADRATLDTVWGQSSLDEADVGRVLALLEVYGVRKTAEAHVARHHDESIRLLESLAVRCHPTPISELRSLVNALSLRTY